MSEETKKLSRRSTIKGIGAVGTAAVLGSAAGPIAPGKAAANTASVRAKIEERVAETTIVDTHEHLIEEEDRLNGNNNRIRSNDWSLLLSHYIDSDLRTSGMPDEAFDAFMSPETDPIKKWDILEPYWGAVRNTGYGQAVEIAMRELYGVDRLSGDTVRAVHEGYLKTIKPGFYKTILQDRGGIESCQVNYLSAPFSESKQSTLLMQDISILGMHIGPNIEAYAPKAGIEVKNLQDWHRVIDWWFERYGQYAVAVKTQAAYSRNIDFDDVPAEKAEGPFKRKIDGQPLSGEDRKLMEDHLFWYAARKATEYNLPVKLHTGYYAGHNSMPLTRLQGNPGAVTNLCRTSPETKFVFMHVCYPFYEELISAAKQWTNCHIDMCWAWIISPVASVNFLKQYLVTAPANKVLTFGGDYIPVEPVLGHVRIARRGIALTLTQLVEEGWLDLDSALELVDPIMRGNARKIFDLEKKTAVLEKAPWL